MFRLSNSASVRLCPRKPPNKHQYFTSVSTYAFWGGLMSYIDIMRARGLFRFCGPKAGVPLWAGLVIVLAIMTPSSLPKQEEALPTNIVDIMQLTKSGQVRYTMETAVLINTIKHHVTLRTILNHHMRTAPLFILRIPVTHFATPTRDDTSGRNARVVIYLHFYFDRVENVG